MGICGKIVTPYAKVIGDLPEPVGLRCLRGMIMVTRTSCPPVNIYSGTACKESAPIKLIRIIVE